VIMHALPLLLLDYDITWREKLIPARIIGGAIENAGGPVLAIAVSFSKSSSGAPLMISALDLIHPPVDLSDKERSTDAISLLTAAISIDPRMPQAYFERGMAYLNLDQDAAAAADFDRALHLDPNYPGARNWRSRAAGSLGDLRRAAEERLKDLRAHPEGPYQGLGVSPQRWADCARALMNAGEHEAARKLLEEYFTTYAQKVTDYAMDETAPMRLLAKLLSDSGNVVEAVEYASRAYSSMHKVPIDVLTYALSLESASRFEEARVVCDEALRINDQMPGLR